MSKAILTAVDGVTAYATTNPLTIRLCGKKDALNIIKGRLTTKNKSFAWKVRSAKEKLKYWQAFDTSVMAPEVAEKVIDKIKACQDVIDEFEPQIIQTFYTESADGLEVPRGFWSLAQAIPGEEHKNKTIKPVLIDGLRPYQKEIVNELMKYNQATGVLATGLGKSKVIISLCMSAIAAKKRVCVVVPTDYLVGQVYDAVKEYIPEVAAYGGKRKKLPLGAPVLVVTAASALKFIEPYDVVVIDESHHTPAKTWVDIFVSSTATHVYNLTATAFRTDGMDLGIHAFGGPIVYNRDTRWGIENGWLKPVKVYISGISALRPDGSSLVLPDRMSAARAYKVLVQNYAVLTAIYKCAATALKQGRKVIVLFKTIDAGEAFKEVCKKDFSFDVAHSGYKKPLNDFRDGNTRILVSNDRLLSEGIDIPDANVLINVIQNSGDVTTYQATGRVLRKTEGDAIVIDIGVNGYSQFSRAQDSRAKVYNAITDDVFLFGANS